MLGPIATGKSNRAIAEEMVIAVRTGDRHATRILANTNSDNRAQAAAYAVRNRLAPL